MSRIEFTSSIEEIVGKLAGSVFQDSYFGMQIRTKVSPTNPQTTLQQLRRGMFGYITQSWRHLTVSQIATFSANAPFGQSGFDFFVSCNVNLSLLALPIITTFTPTAYPAILDLEISDIQPGIFKVAASTALTTVPANHQLIVYVTATKAATKIFTNPSQYQPIQNFVAGTDFVTGVDIYSAYVSHYGGYLIGKRLCIKSALINITNGLRMDGQIFCALIPFLNVAKIIDYDGTFIVNNDGTFIIS